MGDEHIQVMKDGGLVEVKVLAVPVDEENIERFCIMTCATCDADIDEETHEIVFVWGEPLGGGSTFVALHVYCKETCVQDAISAYTDKIQKDIILCWVSMPGVELA